MTASVLLEDESLVKLVLQEREGGEMEVETLVGFVDLVTDDYVIEGAGALADADSVCGAE